MKVLVATDGSERAMKAVRRALELVETRGAQVTIMAVALYAKTDFDELPLNIQDKLEAEAVANLRQAEALFKEKNIPVELILEAGTTPANNILRRAEEGKFDRVVLGSTGASGLDRVLMGSTAAKVVEYAPCDVIVVR
jgi:nucleotide-binding universal stress UspA family protein